MLESLLVTIHVIANLIWIGSIVSVGVLLSTATPENAQSYGLAARKIYLSIATPAFGISFLFGIARLSMSASTYMHLHWFHAKLTFALAVIALHHVIGAKAKRAAESQMTSSKNDAPRSMHSSKSSAILTSALIACASLAVVFVVFQSQLVP
ncbi:MAG: CopD family protein [Polyangiaceae bacterium]